MPDHRHRVPQVAQTPCHRSRIVARAEPAAFDQLRRKLQLPGELPGRLTSAHERAVPDLIRVDLTGLGQPAGDAGDLLQPLGTEWADGIGITIDGVGVADEIEVHGRKLGQTISKASFPPPAGRTIKHRLCARLCPNGQHMKIKSATFEVSAPSLASCPRLPLPEFAFIGRSNVGKSSLINLLAGKRDLAKVSDLPGKTRLLNFFLFNGDWRLTDLPGYGYAHVAKSERAAFNEAVAAYLQRRETLRHTYVLIDSRLPAQGIDREFLEWLPSTGRPYSLIFTKTDKQSASLTQANIARFRTTVLPDLGTEPAVFITSAKTKAGRMELLTHIAAQLTQA